VTEAREAFVIIPEMDLRKKGTKHPILTEAQGIPLAICVTEANRNDVTQLLPLVEGIASIRGKKGRPLRRPKIVQADAGYDSDPHRRELKVLSIRSMIRKRRTDNGSGLGKTRWVVERTHRGCISFAACVFVLRSVLTFMKLV
jgi:IS5 family transposase